MTYKGHFGTNRLPRCCSFCIKTSGAGVQASAWYPAHLWTQQPWRPLPPSASKPQSLGTESPCSCVSLPFLPVIHL